MTETWHRVVKKDRKGKKDSGQHGDSIKSSAGRKCNEFASLLLLVCLCGVDN